MTQFLKVISYQLKDDLTCLKSEYKYSYLEAFLTSFTVGIAENFFAAFSIERQMTTLQSGLLLSLPLLLAVIFNIFGHLFFKNQNLSKQVRRNVILQIISLSGLCLLPLLPITNKIFIFSSLFGLYSLYWFGHFSSQPSWTKWISEIIDDNNGHTYFALRSRLAQLGVLTGLVLGGIVLHSKRLQIPGNFLFFSLFSLGICAQFFKLYTLKKHTQSESILVFSVSKMKVLFKQSRSFFSGYALFNLSLFLSSPFVTGYLLNERKINYFDFMLITASLIFGKIFMTYLLSIKEPSIQPYKMMALGGLIAAPLPLLWPFCFNTQLMILLNFSSGLCWALWDIGLSLSFFKNVSAQDKIETVSLYNMIGITTQVVGTLIGAFFIKYVYLSNYDHAFMAAGLIRFLCILPFQKTKGLDNYLSSSAKMTSIKEAS